MSADSKILLPAFLTAQPRYHGRQPDTELLKISHDGQRILFRGTVSNEQIESGKLTFLLGKKDSLKGRSHSPDSPGYIEFLAICHRTSERVLIRGVVDKILKSKTMSVDNRKNKGMTNDKYADELKRVHSALLSQTDALVNIQFIAKHTGRAVSSIYRDIKNDLLPKAIKQGGSSRWSFTAVEAYAHGKAAEVTIDKSQPLSL